MNATAVIAEDEALLAQALQHELAAAWPELQVLAVAPHGAAAVDQALKQRPQVLFLDIRMPGMSGLEAAEALAEAWPAHEAAFPLIVFITAYDQYAVQAFERSAVDYLLKPVQPARLERCCARLRQLLAQRDAAPNTQATLDTALGQLRELLDAQAGAPAAPPRLSVIQASQGATLHFVPVEQVLYFEAADKYVRVVTAEQEYLIRTSLRELLPQLDPQRFWQVHRGTVVSAPAIAKAVRDDTGRITVHLRERADTLSVSRLYAHLFKAM
jgi:DNA-binding LytR/AlgR family response regulator